jgi:hypothetical protein
LQNFLESDFVVVDPVIELVEEEEGECKEVMVSVS